MKRYRVLYPVEAATGQQTYEVEADSPEAAIAASRDAECVHEEIEVVRLGEPEVEEIEESR